MIDTRIAQVSDAEFADRLRRTQEAMAREGCDLLVAWSDCYRMSNVRWLANYRAFDGVIPYSALVLVPAKGDPILFATELLIPTAQAESCIKDVRGIRRDLDAALKEWAASGNIRKVGIAGYRYLTLETWDVIRNALPAEIKVEPTGLMEILKSVKSEAEIHNMRIAGLLADVGCAAIRDTARVGVSERELARAAYSAMFAQGADGIAFDVMVQTGENAFREYLKRPTDRQLKDGDLILIDMGCRFAGYASDNARGAVLGTASREAQRALDVSLEAFRASLKVLRPGMTAGEFCAPAHEILMKNGYMKPGDGQQMGHGTGMDPEEEFPLIFTGCPHKLLENQAFCFAVTVLVPGVGGCRVEDPIIVRADGAESLSKFPYENAWPSR